MKAFHLILVAFGMGSLSAAELTIPNTFTAGTPAKASEVNANFNAVKSAVDDKETRVTSLETDNTANKTAISSLQTSVTGKQNRVAGTCAVGSAIRTINADGFVLCDKAIKDGVVALTGHSFQRLDDNETTNCSARAASSFYFTGSSTGLCLAGADVHLPDGVTPSQLQCFVRDLSTPGGSGQFTGIELDRIYLADGTGQQIFVLPDSNDSGNQNLASTTPISSNHAVDNSQYAYRIVVPFNGNGATFAALGLNLVLHGCTVNYTAP